MRQALVNKVHNFNEIMGVGRHCSLLGPGRRIRVFFYWCRVTPGCFSLHIVHYFHYPFFRAYLHEYFFFLLSNVLTKLKYGPLY